jgi:hypothetical protein
MYGPAPFMVIAPASGGPRPLYEDIYTVGETAKEFITQHGWLRSRRILPPMTVSDG